MTTFADRVQETTLSEGSGPFALRGRSPNRRTLAEGFGTGTTDCVLCIEDDAGANFVIGVFPLISGSVLGEATTIYASSNGGDPVVFGPGKKNIFSTVPATIVAQLLASGGGGSTPSVPVLLAAPVVTGTGTVGQLLNTTDGAWSETPTSFDYQWLRNGNAISGATSSSYLLLTADASTAIRCSVRASNATGPATTAALSNAITVAAVSGPPPPPPPPAGPDTRPGWFAAPANAATVGTSGLISGRTVLGNSTNGGKAGTATGITTTGSNFAWFAVANSVVPTFTDVASGFAGGFTAAGTFTDTNGTVWSLYVSDYPASYTNASVTLS